MSFAADVKSFVDAYKTMADTSTKAGEAKSKADYYQNLIRQGDVSSKQRQQQLDHQAENDRAKLDQQSKYQQGELGMRGAAIAETSRHNRASEGVAQQNSDSLRAIRAQPGAINPADLINQFGTPGAAGPAPMQALPTQQPAQPAAPLQSSPVSDDTAGDGNDDTPRYAEGGVVQPAQSAPQQPQQALETDSPVSGADDEGGGSAGGDQNVQPVAQGDGKRTSGGFSLRDVLSRWGVSAPKGALPSDPNRVKNPVALGLDELQRSVTGSGALPTSGAGPAALRDHSNTPTHEDIDQLGKIVDPHGQLDNASRWVAINDATVNFWLAHGDPQKAASTAKALIMYGARESQLYGQAAAEALQKGDKATAISYLKRAYDLVPDGSKLDADLDQNGDIHARVVGPDGGVKDLGTFGAPQVFQMALKVKSGQAYYRRLMDVATGNIGAQGGDQQAAEKPVAMRDRDSAMQQINALGDRLKTVDQEHIEPIKGAAAQLLTSNNILPEQAINAVTELAHAGKPTYVTTPVQGGGARVKLSNGLQLTLNPNQLATIAMLRGAAEKKVAAEKSKADEETARGLRRSALTREMGQSLKGRVNPMAEEARTGRLKPAVRALIKPDQSTPGAQ